MLFGAVVQYSLHIIAQMCPRLHGHAVGLNRVNRRRGWQTAKYGPIGIANL